MSEDKTEKEHKIINNFISSENDNIYDKRNYEIYNESNNYNNKLLKESNNYNNKLLKESIEDIQSLCKKYDEEKNTNRTHPSAELKHPSAELKHPPKKGQSR